MSAISESRVRAMVTSIEDHPKNWDQGYFIRRRLLRPTTMCAAGWVCHNAGLNVRGLEKLDAADRTAITLLGIDGGQANAIFGYTQQDGRHPTIAEFKARVTEVTGVVFEDTP